MAPNVPSSQAHKVSQATNLRARPLGSCVSDLSKEIRDSNLNDSTVQSLNDELMIRTPRPFWKRKWQPIDVLRLIPVFFLHLMCLCAPFYFTWPAFFVAIVLQFITGLFGLGVSYHRHLTHKSFTLPKWLEYVFAYCGVLAGQGNPIDWVSSHRFHHQSTDGNKDPHSPNEGFWFSHMNWIFDKDYITQKCGEASNVSDLRKQPFYTFIEKTYYLHPAALAPVLYAFGGIPFVLWGLGVRTAYVFHATSFVNSVCHRWGERAWDTSDLSRNNWWVALLTYGEGWRNNHHAFEYSARHGLEWWQLDMTWNVIRLLEAIGLATNVKLPTEKHKNRLASNH